MRTSDSLRALQGQVTAEVPVSGQATRIWLGIVTAINPDHTVDVRPLQGRATKVACPYPSWYEKPAAGDQVLVCDLNGDPLTPVVMLPFNAGSDSTLPYIHATIADQDPQDPSG